MKEIKEAKISDDVFRSRVLITYGSHENIAKWYKSKGIPSSVNIQFAGFTEVLESVTGENIYHVHFTTYGFSVVVHETNHLTFDILSDRGIKFNKHTKEVFAYYQDWIAGKCRDYLDKWTKEDGTILKKDN
jgi:hypothetical protein